jgi:E3 ubiquitin-protein ligase RNF115/126
LGGNPGDYVWGCESLDGIVTQLLNQMDDSRPPALGKDKIVVGILKEN